MGIESGRKHVVVLQPKLMVIHRMASDLVYHAQREPDQRTPLNMHS
jgi:hypothetical protein